MVGMKLLLCSVPLLLLGQETERCFGNPSLPLCDAVFGMEVAGEALCLQPSVEGVSYSIRNDIRGNGTPGGPILDLKPSWQPAFRIACSYLPNITARLVWMHLAGTTESRAHDDLSFPNLGLEELWIPPMSSLVISQKASLHWYLDLDVVDLEVGKRYAVSPFLSFNPACGLRIARIDQSFHARYHSSSQISSAQAENDFLSVGVRMGLDSEWILVSDWSIQVKGAAALLYGRFETLYESPQEEIKEDFYRLEPNAEFGVGIGWKRCLSNGYCQLGFRFGYEAQIFWDQNQFRRFLGSDAPTVALQQVSNLSVQGFSLRGQVAF